MQAGAVASVPSDCALEHLGRPAPAAAGKHVKPLPVRAPELTRRVATVSGHSVHYESLALCPARISQQRHRSGRIEQASPIVRITHGSRRPQSPGTLRKISDSDRKPEFDSDPVESQCTPSERERKAWRCSSSGRSETSTTGPRPASACVAGSSFSWPCVSFTTPCI